MEDFSFDELSMSMPMSLVVFEGIEEENDDEVDVATDLVVDWICQFCPAY
jgi:hypothetical protein